MSHAIFPSQIPPLNNYQCRPPHTCGAPLPPFGRAMAHRDERWQSYMSKVLSSFRGTPPDVPLSPLIEVSPSTVQREEASSYTPSPLHNLRTIVQLGPKRQLDLERTPEHTTPPPLYPPFKALDVTAQIVLLLVNGSLGSEHKQRGYVDMVCWYVFLIDWPFWYELQTHYTDDDLPDSASTPCPWFAPLFVFYHLYCIVLYISSSYHYDICSALPSICSHIKHCSLLRTTHLHIRFLPFA